jgi:ABC-type oligopeptide transport system substrate-binding subunit
MLRVGGLLSMTFLALVACGGGTSPGRSSALAPDQTLRFPIFDETHQMDPAQADAETDQELAQNMFDGLTKFDSKLNVVPDIAASMPEVSSDGLTYTFKLRQNVTFSNGDKVTAKDVLYSWNRAAAIDGAYGSSLAPIAGFKKVSANSKLPAAQLQQLLVKGDPSVSMDGLTAPDGPDGYTVQVKLSSPAGYFLSGISLSDSVGQIVDQKAISQDPQTWWQNPATAIGTGAYKITSHVPKQSYDFTAVDNWWGSPQPTVKKVHIDILQDIPTGIQAYEQGKYDIVGYGGYSTLPLQEVQRIKAAPKESKELLLHPKVRTYWVSYNMVHDAVRTAAGPFLTDAPNSLKLRQAFALAVDKQQLVATVCGNLLCTPATGGLITKGLTGYLGDDSDPLAKFDPARARQLLKEADPTGTRTQGLTYTYDPENSLNQPTAVFLQDQWQRNLGVHVNVQAENHSQFIPDRQSGKFVLSRDGWQADYNHPQDWYDNNYGSGLGCPDSFCSSGWTSKAYDNTLAQADSEPLSKALPLYDKLGKMLSDNAVYIPLYYQVGAFLIKPYLEGAGTNNFFDNYWDQVKIHQH